MLFVKVFPHSFNFPIDKQDRLVLATFAHRQHRNGDRTVLESRVPYELDARKHASAYKILAGLCNCTPTHICNIENGKIGISLELLFKISILLGKSMDYFVMDNPGVDPQVKINAEIAPKLARCNPQMLDIVDTILDKLIHYQDSFCHSAYESV